MAEKEHLYLIRQGATIWNQWRKKNPEQTPDLFSVNLSFSDLCSVDLSQANLWEAKLKNSRMRKALFKEADLCFSDLSGVDFTGADLSGANLTEADLSWSDLSHANMENTNLWAANLHGANLTGTNLQRANLNEANLSHAILDDVNLREASLNDTKFTKSRITHTDFCHANMDNSDFTDAEIEWCIFGNVDLSMLKGLDTVRHYGPSIIGINALSLPGSAIPINFLKAAGVPDHLLSYAKTQEQKKTGLNSCFVIYSNEDHEFVQKIHIDLENSGISCWLAIDDLETEVKISRAIRFFEVIVLVLSKHLIYNDWLEEFITSVFEEEKKRKKRMLFPISLDFEVMRASKAWAKDITRTRHIFNFGQWHNDKAYQAAFEHLLKDLCRVTSPIIKSAKSVSEKPPEKAGKEDEIDAIVKLLLSFSMFQTLEPDQVRELVSFLKLKKYSRGTTIVQKGDPGKNLYIIVSGKVEVLGDGGISIAFMGKGEVFGEMSLLSGKPVGATIKVVEPAAVLYMSAKDFRSVLNKHPSLQMYFTQLLAQRLAEIHDVRAEEFMSGMVGKLSEIPPSELFQTFNINQKTGIVSLMLSRGPASVSFREGNLIRAKYNGLTGVDAFYEILKEREGRFKFVPGLPDDELRAPELGDFMWLLMEGIRRIDESTAAT